MGSKRRKTRQDIRIKHSNKWSKGSNGTEKNRERKIGMEHGKRILHKRENRNESKNRNIKCNNKTNNAIWNGNTRINGSTTSKDSKSINGIYEENNRKRAKTKNKETEMEPWARQRGNKNEKERGDKKKMEDTDIPKHIK